MSENTPDTTAAEIATAISAPTETTNTQAELTTEPHTCGGATCTEPCCEGKAQDV